MGLVFYKKKSIQTKYTPDDIQRIFSDVINNPGENAEVEKLLLNDWYVRINYGGNRFQIAIGRNAPVYERSGLHSVLKGKIRENKDTKGATVSMIARPSNEYLFGLSLVFLFITAVLFCSILKNITPPIIISSILLFLFYTLFLVDFNLQLKAYKQVIDNFFN